LANSRYYVVRSIIWDEEPQIRVVQDSRNPDQASPPTGNNSHVLPRVLAHLTLPMMRIVQIGNGDTQRLDTSGGPILTTSHGNLNVLGPIEASFDVVIYFRGSLAQICPFIGFVGKAMLVGTLGAPDDAGGGAAGIEARVWAMAFVSISKLTVDFGALFAVR